MARATEERRQALREKLIDLAYARIAAHGSAALRARDLASEAGCSVGAIYTVFGDMRDLLVAVNGRTFRDLGAHVAKAVATSGAETPHDRMIAMAGGYLDYAVAHPQRWRALFDIALTEADAPPDWYLVALDELLAMIDAPLGELFPTLDAEELRVRTRALFSSVHGIVLLGLEERISGVARARVMEMIRFVLTSIGSSQKI